MALAAPGNPRNYVTLTQLAKRLGMDRSATRRYVLQAGHVFSRVRDPQSRQMAIALPIEEAQQLISYRQQQGFELPPQEPPRSLSEMVRAALLADFDRPDAEIALQVVEEAADLPENQFIELMVTAVTPVVGDRRRQVRRELTAATFPDPVSTTSEGEPKNVAHSVLLPAPPSESEASAQTTRATHGLSGAPRAQAGPLSGPLLAGRQPTRDVLELLGLDPDAPRDASPIERRQRWLNSRIYIPGTGHPLVGEATAADHRARAEYLKEMRAAYNRSMEFNIDLHIAVAEEIETAGKTCLFELYPDLRK